MSQPQLKRVTVYPPGAEAIAWPASAFAPDQSGNGILTFMDAEGKHSGEPGGFGRYVMVPHMLVFSPPSAIVTATGLPVVGLRS